MGEHLKFCNILLSGAQAAIFMDLILTTPSSVLFFCYLDSADKAVHDYFVNPNLTKRFT